MTDELSIKNIVFRGKHLCKPLSETNSKYIYELYFNQIAEEFVLFKVENSFVDALRLDKCPYCNLSPLEISTTVKKPLFLND